MKADIESSLITCPKTYEDIEIFIESVIGCGEQGNDGELCKSADVVVLDQNIDLIDTDNETAYGTDIAQTLRDRNFKGPILLRTGNSSLHEKEKYMASGTIDSCMGKDGHHDDLAARIFYLYALRKGSAKRT